MRTPQVTKLMKANPTTANGNSEATAATPGTACSDVCRPTAPTVSAQQITPVTVTVTSFIGSPDLRRQMQDWLQEHTAPAPDDHLALLVWWRQFKRNLAAKCGELHCASRNLSAEAGVTLYKSGDRADPFPATPTISLG